MSSPDVVVVGDVNVDVLARVDHYPAPGGHAVAPEVRMESGGSAANTATLLGRLGLDVAMLGVVGGDPLADLALRSLRAASVDISRVRRLSEVSTGLFFVAVTPDGERTMFGGRGANSQLSPADVDPDTIKAARWLHLSGYPLLSESGVAALQTAIAAARGAGIPISFDVGIGPQTQRWRQAVLELATQVDVLLPNEVEAESLTGETDPAEVAHRLRAIGPTVVGVKRGAAGCYVSAGPHAWALPAFEVDAVDSTGAGDAFDAGFIAGWLAGLDEVCCSLLANALGGLATTQVGAGRAVEGPAEVLAFLRHHRDDSRWAGRRNEFDRIYEWLLPSSRR